MGIPTARSRPTAPSGWGVGRGPSRTGQQRQTHLPGVSPVPTPTAACQRWQGKCIFQTRPPDGHQSPPSICPWLTSHGPGFKHSPPVRLKEFPKAENELRGVKSGLLGLLTGLHRPELNVGREKRNTQERDGQWRQTQRSQLRAWQALLQWARACHRQQGDLETAPCPEGPELRPLCHRLGAWLRASVLCRKEVFLPYLPFSDGRFIKLFQI